MQSAEIQYSTTPKKILMSTMHVLKLSFLCTLFVRASFAGPVNLIGPDGGETFLVGDTLAIVWDVDHAGIGARGLTIDISLDGGLYWIVINTLGHGITEADTQIYHGTSRGTYRWQVPDSVADPNGGPLNSVSKLCRIKIYDPYGSEEDMDVSDDNFSIASAAMKADRINPAAHSVHISPLMQNGAAGIYSMQGKVLANRNLYMAKGMYAVKSFAGRKKAAAIIDIKQYGLKMSQ
jgi:hypothetical protein